MLTRLLVAVWSLGVVSAFVAPQSPSFAVNSRLRMSADMDAPKPFGVVVHTEIDPNRMAEFLKLIETNAIKTRKEPECVRFDVLRSQEAPNQFIFYELYKTSAAIEHHKKQPHYQAWADFKESGGTLSAVTYKNDGEFVSL
jgi:(4S)-4-hydroxy-5-phosphonooxypentane-2,3-dione isomerase